MAETNTPNYKWVKPDIGGDASTWGNVLNQTTDAIDSVVYANQQAGVPIGTILMFGGPQSKLPSGWVLCAGESLDTTAYAALFAVIGYMYGGSGSSFNVPNFVGTFPMGMTNGEVLGQTGGEASHVLTGAEMAPHAHPIVDVAHNHGVNVSQSPHGHGDPGHSHGVNDPGHVHTGVMKQLAGFFALAAQNPQIVSGSTDGALTGISIQAAGSNIQAANANIGVSLNASGTGLSTTQNAGSGAAHNNLPTFLQINFIIRFQ